MKNVRKTVRKERLEDEAQNMRELLANLKDYLKKLVFDDIDLQTINEIWIETIEEKIKSEDKFTPGPWSAPDEGNLRGAVVTKDGKMVCDPSGAGRHEGEAEANARLIAAAPEMYYILDIIDAYHAIKGVNNRWERTISKLLKKVRGEE